MAEQADIVIVGAGQAGGRAAQAARHAPFEGRIVLIGDEAQPPYERPPLSKDVLTGATPVEKTYIGPLEQYAEFKIDLWTGTRAEKLDPAAHKLTLSGKHGGELIYKKLLIVTGGRVRKLPAKGAELEGVHYIRTIDDSLALKPKLVEGAKVVVIGGGFIGLEAAASARKLGCEVTILEMQPTLLGRVCDKWVGDWYVGLHRKHGATVITQAVIDGIEGDGKVTGVRLGDGTVLPADIVVVGIGIVPNVELATEAGIKADNGIVVDQFGHTSAPDVYAAGDVANLPVLVHGIQARLETWANAQNGGIAVANNMVAELKGDAPKPFNDIPWFWSDQHGVNLQIVGVPTGWDKVVTRGDPDTGKFMLFYLHGGKVVAANIFNNGREMRFAKQMVQSGKIVAESDLADEALKLMDLAKP
ncbi:MAG: NAD(P)/FAD-dependent oxidoreductase [Alphaproteobacteria bacterium]